MKATQFWHLAKLVESSCECVIERYAKAYMIHWAFGEWSDGWECTRDDDVHVHGIVGNEIYHDDDLTPKRARAAQYLELSWGDGWAFWIGKNCDEGMLEQACDATLMRSLLNRVAFDEIDDETLAKAAKILGITVEELREMAE